LRRIEEKIKRDLFYIKRQVPAIDNPLILAGEYPEIDMRNG